MTFVSLQYGEADRDTVALRRDFGILVADASEIDEFNDLDGLATLIAACDAIVSIDNTTVYLGVALGQPTQILLPLEGDWRWGQTWPDSYWYSTVTLLWVLSSKTFVRPERLKLSSGGGRSVPSMSLWSLNDQQIDHDH